MAVVVEGISSNHVHFYVNYENSIVRPNLSTRVSSTHTLATPWTDVDLILKSMEVPVEQTGAADTGRA